MKDQLFKRKVLFSLLAVVMCLGFTAMSYGQAVISVDPAEVESPAAGEELVVNINIMGGEGVAGYEVDISFDPTALEYVSSANADYLPAGAFAVPASVSEAGDSVKIAATAIGATADGDGTLATVTFTVLEAKASTIGIANAIVSNAAADALEVTTADGMVTVPAAEEPAAEEEEPAAEEDAEEPAAEEEDTEEPAAEEETPAEEEDAEEPAAEEETPAEEEDTEEPAAEEETPAEGEDTEEPAAEEETPAEEDTEEPAAEEETPAEEPVADEGPGFDITLDPGLNMISVPLMPEEPYTAKSLAAMLGATVVIRLDTATQNFDGYTAIDEGDGFGIEGGIGYIVNTPDGAMVKFTGSAWDNQPEPEEPAPEEEAPAEEPVAEEETPAEEPAAEGEAPAEEEVAEEPSEEEAPAEEEVAEEPAEEEAPAAEEEVAEAPAAEEEVVEEPAADEEAPAAPMLSTYKSAWAFIVTSDIRGMNTGTNYTLVAENLRTGTIATETITSDAKRSSAVWADLNRKSVVEAGDKLKVALYDERSHIVSGPFERTVARADIRNAFLSLQLTVGDVRPEDTILAQNYPNPFNPETWIPYQLSKSTEVTISIHNIAGHLVRTLDLGLKPVGSYMTPATAAYWDGKNSVGERVASGIYFYTLQTADFAATRRMVILK